MRQIETREQFEQALDDLQAAHTSQDRAEIIADIRRSMGPVPAVEAMESPLEAQVGPSEVPETETVHYADGSSATGPGPLPDHSPDGAPAVDQPQADPVHEGESAADPEAATDLTE